jgi:enoyl-CoA hydratase/carnithine racemase
MALQIEKAIDGWRDADVDLVMIDAVGERAFCAGGDIAEMYRSGLDGNLGYGRRFWADEYRLNAKIFEYCKPVVSFLQGFTMGGGVGVGCHGGHRIVGETSQIAMPECSIGLVPDVGGSLMLARCKGHLGEYIGLTGARMNAADAIHAGFADGFVPEAKWEALKSELIAGDIGAISYETPPLGSLPGVLPDIDRHFAGKTLLDVAQSLAQDTSDFAERTLTSLRRNAPLAMACSTKIIRQLTPKDSIRAALNLEYRFTYRAVAQGDFIEGIRAVIVDKDRNPKWAHRSISDLSMEDVDRMLAPLGEDALNWPDEP